MWYRIVVESSPLIKSRSLEHLVIPSPIKNTKHYSRDQLFIRMDSSQGHLERGGAHILPPQVFILTHDKPEEQYYLTSHLNPNTSFIEFLCDQTRSKGLYDSTAAHAYVVKSCLRSFHQRYIRRDLGLYKDPEADGVEDRIIFRWVSIYPRFTLSWFSYIEPDLGAHCLQNGLIICSIVHLKMMLLWPAWICVSGKRERRTILRQSWAG